MSKTALFVWMVRYQQQAGRSDWLYFAPRTQHKQVIF
jgi:hypothetical protein